MVGGVAVTEDKNEKYSFFLSWPGTQCNCPFLQTLDSLLGEQLFGRRSATHGKEGGPNHKLIEGFCSPRVKDRRGIVCFPIGGQIFPENTLQGGSHGGRRRRNDIQDMGFVADVTWVPMMLSSS